MIAAEPSYLYEYNTLGASFLNLGTELIGASLIFSIMILRKTPRRLVLLVVIALSFLLTSWILSYYIYTDFNRNPNFYNEDIYTMFTFVKDFLLNLSTEIGGAVIIIVLLEDVAKALEIGIKQ